MNELLNKYDDLLKDTGPAAIVMKQWLQPVGGDVFFPPTYANPSQKKGDPPVYNIDRFNALDVKFRFENKEKDRKLDIDASKVESQHSVCVVDSIPSQANRIEPAFGRLADKDGNPIRLVPTVVITAKVKTDDGEIEQTVNLLEAGHRAADAIVQLSSLRSDLTKAIKTRKQGNSIPLAKIAPTSLVFGMWDSRESGVKVPRILSSIIRAYDVLEHRRSSQFNAAIDYEAAGVVPDKKEKKLSKVGMDGAPATFQHGGIEARGGIRRDSSINLCTLRDLRGTTDDETKKLQRYILGLALVAITYFDGKTLNLRQGCQLVGVKDKPMVRQLIHADGSEIPFAIDPLECLAYAIKAAADFGIGEDRKDVKFDPKLAKAALKKSKKEEQEENT